MYRKGLDVLLEASEQIRAGPVSYDVRFLMIGSGHHEAVLRERLERAELSGVQWLHRYELDRTVMRR
jgi:hypothetical protein